ncbi:efflux transporter outer membrane subunit [Xanthomonas euvesicatoria]|uniref:efflux transporter outer membrane subunit n=1 Tax=Xanthomonas euvesicatoria TaxID=456327 RepID=UPI00080DE5B6|nr:efflux transporter outer membrane subunit [Xanthomonas euvesicatoria]MCC8802800.1 efflux transporter outer membrane subunit [Xanthomonas euvesicatoria pv. euvesicatoria]MCC8809963.1 efflux transporter outer membrane subunit [Xanthomonas euvesicatoria pv. euvesicatoria]MCC8820095.1 efflux transporter outer membrane subunit [Xanthomonas euvesicatoria pv. euvesicatoria]OCG92838.1 histidine kinase [Xanthomonas euvesicatoria]
MTDVRNALLAGAVAVSLAACAVGPDFQRPALPAADRYTANALPATIVDADAAHGGAQQFEPGQDVPAAWWRAFGSPQLNAVVERALRANPDLQAADAALRQAQQTLAAQRGAWLPQADLHVDASRQRDSVVPAPDAGIDTPYALRTAQLSVSYTLDVFGGTRRQVEAAGAQAQAQRDQRDAAYLSLTANVVNAAIGEAAVRAQLEAARAQVAIAEQLCTLTERQQTLGALGAAQVLAQRTALAQAQAAVPGLEKQLEQQRTLLAILGGQLPGDAAGAPFTLDTLKLPAQLPLSLPSRLVDRRPDIRAAEAQAHAASALIGVAAAARLPSITLSVAGGGSASSVGRMFAAGNTQWSVAGSLLQPLFHGGALAHQQRAAEAGYAQAMAQYRSVVLNAFGEVSNALTALQSDAQSLRACADAQALAERTLALAQRQQTVGAVGMADLLQAQQAYQSTQAATVQAQAARYTDTVALYQALGGGPWWSPAAQTPKPAAP